jgi:hypothetical protein
MPYRTGTIDEKTTHLKKAIVSKSDRSRTNAEINIAGKVRVLRKSREPETTSGVYVSEQQTIVRYGSQIKVGTRRGGRCRLNIAATARRSATTFKTAPSVKPSPYLLISSKESKLARESTKRKNEYQTMITTEILLDLGRLSRSAFLGS